MTAYRNQAYRAWQEAALLVLAMIAANGTPASRLPGGPLCCTSQPLHDMDAMLIAPAAAWPGLLRMPPDTRCIPGPSVRHNPVPAC